MHDQTIYAHKYKIDDNVDVDYLECGHQSIYWITCEFVIETSRILKKVYVNLYKFGKLFIFYYSNNR